jgi:hypothetical protein
MAKDKKKKEIPTITRMEMFCCPKPTINEKNIKALETLMQDKGFKEEIGHRYEGIIDAYRAGKKGK